MTGHPTPRLFDGRSPAVVLFDLDGTLSDSAHGIIASMRHAFDIHGVAQPTDDVMRTFVGPPFAQALAGLGFEQPEIDEIVTTYRADYNAGRLFENDLYPGIVEALATLQRAGTCLAVATSKPQATARRIVEHFGLQQYLCDGIETVFGADPQRPGDSKADVIGRALTGLDVAPGPDVVMVGDRKHDVEGARTHSLACIGVAWGYAPESELRDAGAVSVVESPQELVDLLLAR